MKTLKELKEIALENMVRNEFHSHIQVRSGWEDCIQLHWEINMFCRTVSFYCDEKVGYTAEVRNWDNTFTRTSQIMFENLEAFNAWCDEKRKTNE